MLALRLEAWFLTAYWDRVGQVVFHKEERQPRSGLDKETNPRTMDVSNMRHRTNDCVESRHPVRLRTALVRGGQARLAGCVLMALAMGGCGPAVDPSGAVWRETPRGALSPMGFADTLEPVLPAVVRVGTLGESESGEQGVGGVGSGAIIDTEHRLILTNAHVVEGGTGYFIDLADGRQVRAELVGIDPPTDIAVLRAPVSGAPAIAFADSDAARVGDVVFAVGYPFGIDQTVSLGIISGLGRSTSADQLQDFIQTDAAINSGNSGGPLLDSSGRLVGVNTAILSRTGGSIGIGFSVPSNLATEVVAQLVEHGEVRRGAIGVVLDRVSEAASKVAGIDHWDGALVVRVLPESTAAQAGLAPGDIITAFNGRTIRTPQALRTWIGVSRPDKPHTITYVRRGEVTTAPVSLRPVRSGIVRNLEQIGALVREIAPGDRLPDNVDGAFVRGVVPGSPADIAGLTAGDVIVGVNNELATSAHVCDVLVSQTRGRVRLLVYRGGGVVPVIVQ